MEQQSSNNDKITEAKQKYAHRNLELAFKYELVGSKLREILRFHLSATAMEQQSSNNSKITEAKQKYAHLLKNLNHGHTLAEKRQYRYRCRRQCQWLLF